jgi:hypothetical protein
VFTAQSGFRSPHPYLGSLLKVVLLRHIVRIVAILPCSVQKQWFADAGAGATASLRWKAVSLHVAADDAVDLRLEDIERVHTLVLGWLRRQSLAYVVIEVDPTARDFTLVCRGERVRKVVLAPVIIAHPRFEPPVRRRVVLRLEAQLRTPSSATRAPQPCTHTRTGHRELTCHLPTACVAYWAELTLARICGSNLYSKGTPPSSLGLR